MTVVRIPASENRGGRVCPVTWLVCAILLIGAAEPGLVSGQSAAGIGERMPMMHGDSMPQMAAGRMVMPTDDHKVFRLIRPSIAAVQLKLSEAGSFSGTINGLLGLSTVRALADYQRSHGLEATGLPDLELVLTLMDWDGPSERVGEHLDLESNPETMDGHRMGGEMMNRMPGMGGDAAMGSTLHEDRVEGDPHLPKSLGLMEMPAMVVDNRHTRAVRATREFVAVLQLRLIEDRFFDGLARGLPQDAGLADGIMRYQRSRGLDETGFFDVATTLELLGSDSKRLIAEYHALIDLEGTPVAMDQELMWVSNGRASTRQKGR